MTHISELQPQEESVRALNWPPEFWKRMQERKAVKAEVQRIEDMLVSAGIIKINEVDKDDPYSYRIEVLHHNVVVYDKDGNLLGSGQINGIGSVYSPTLRLYNQISYNSVSVKYEDIGSVVKASMEYSPIN